MAFQLSTASARTAFNVGGGVYSSRRSVGMTGNQNGLQFNKGKATVTMRKKEIHPQWYDEAKVICNGEEVMRCGGTKDTYVVDIWSGNHPFFQGNTSTVVVDEGRVNRFARRYQGLDSLSNVATISNQNLTAEDALAARKAAKEELANMKPAKSAKGKGKK
uniref:Large ribosomal subunit protein bL31c n=1 Tax=Tetraselmis sp. GSL018 TaxID=582737 RepID=A0A061R3Z5_9CHLO|mmetsp:Transcript_18918/g.45182  ORF Transcript_18918/g.45182 Transcript_18918/m.45182 type:complete len:161 (-) Transcript_18918:66-548(-)